jgi:hypothetical protein
LAGLIIAIRRRKEHPQVSRLAVLGLGILFLQKTMYSLFLAYFSRYSNIVGDNERNVFVGTVSLISLLIEALGWILVLWALFGYREKDKRKPHEVDDEEISLIN